MPSTSRSNVSPPNNGRARLWQFIAAIIGTVIVSIAGAFFAFGSQQQEQLVRLEAQESEAERQREIDQATIRALNESIRIVQARLAELETRIAVNEARIESFATTSEGGGE